MKIYTKTGDKGTTALASGQRVSKASDRVESYGSVDFLNSWLGRIIAELGEEQPDISAQLTAIQQSLFDCQTDLANPKAGPGTWRMHEEPTTKLETWIDSYTEGLTPLNRFILPGGTVLASDCHVARTLVRAAERKVVKLTRTGVVNPDVIKFLNRLSDYFFTLAREMNRLGNKEDIFYDNKK